MKLRSRSSIIIHSGHHSCLPVVRGKQHGSRRSATDRLQSQNFVRTQTLTRGAATGEPQEQNRQYYMVTYGKSLPTKLVTWLGMLPERCRCLLLWNWESYGWLIWGPIYSRPRVESLTNLQALSSCLSNCLSKYKVTMLKVRCKGGTILNKEAFMACQRMLESPGALGHKTS